jgi:hypothetical protein
MVSLHCSALPPFIKSRTRPPPISPLRIQICFALLCSAVRTLPLPHLLLRPVMDRRLRGSPRAAERDHHHQRFLRPGALARLRDSRIVARSLRSSACLLLPRSLPAPPTPPPVSAAAEQGGVPRFLGTGCWGPGRYPLRRRIAAARAVAFLQPPLPDTAFLDALAA